MTNADLQPVLMEGSAKERDALRCVIYLRASTREQAEK